MKKYYKNKYMLAVYDKDDELCVVADTIKELAGIIGKAPIDVRKIVNGNKGFFFNKKRCKVHLIEVEEKDND